MEHQYRMGIDTIGFTKFGLVQLRHFYNEEQNLQFPSQSPQVLNSNLGNTGLVVNQVDIKPPVKDKKRRTRGTPAQVRPCKVCGESAGKHSYYGGEVCPSCRAFFRRSVQSGYNNSYKCDEGGTCKVTLATRKKCQHCRYRLCLAAGMKTSWVLTEEERKQKFEGKGKAYKRLEVDVKKAVDIDLSDEETLHINSLVKTSGHFERSKVNDMETSLLRNIVKMIAFKHPLPASGQKQLREVLTRRFKKIAKRVPEFTMLCYRDREEVRKSFEHLIAHILSDFGPQYPLPRRDAHLFIFQALRDMAGAVHPTDGGGGGGQALQQAEVSQCYRTCRPASSNVVHFH